MAQHELHRLSLPLATHWERVSCEDVDCPRYINGFQVIVPGGGPLAAWIRTNLRASHNWREELQDGGLMAFSFPPGQQCFKGLAGEHKFPTGRPAILTQQRVNHEPRVLRPDDWVDSYQESHDRFVRLVQRG